MWVNNTGACGSLVAGEWFCAYAILEEASATAGNEIYYCASQAGNFQLDHADGPTPATCSACWTP